MSAGQEDTSVIEIDNQTNVAKLQELYLPKVFNSSVIGALIAFLFVNFVAKQSITAINTFIIILFWVHSLRKKKHVVSLRILIVLPVHIISNSYFIRTANLLIDSDSKKKLFVTKQLNSIGFSVQPIKFSAAWRIQLLQLLAIAFLWLFLITFETIRSRKNYQNKKLIVPNNILPTIWYWHGLCIGIVFAFLIALCSANTFKYDVVFMLAVLITGILVWQIQFLRRWWLFRATHTVVVLVAIILLTVTSINHTKISNYDSSQNLVNIQGNSTNFSNEIYSIPVALPENIVNNIRNSTVHNNQALKSTSNDIMKLAHTLDSMEATIASDQLVSKSFRVTKQNSTKSDAKSRLLKILSIIALIAKLIVSIILSLNGWRKGESTWQIFRIDRDAIKRKNELKKHGMKTFMSIEVDSFNLPEIDKSKAISDSNSIQSREELMLRSDIATEVSQSSNKIYSTAINRSTYIEEQSQFVDSNHENNLIFLKPKIKKQDVPRYKIKSLLLPECIDEKREISGVLKLRDYEPEYITIYINSNDITENYTGLNKAETPKKCIRMPTLIGTLRRETAKLDDNISCLKVRLKTIKPDVAIDSNQLDQATDTSDAPPTLKYYFDQDAYKNSSQIIEKQEENVALTNESLENISVKQDKEFDTNSSENYLSHFNITPASVSLDTSEIKLFSSSATPSSIYHNNISSRYVEPTKRAIDVSPNTLKSGIAKLLHDTPCNKETFETMKQFKSGVAIARSVDLENRGATITFKYHNAYNEEQKAFA